MIMTCDSVNYYSKMTNICDEYGLHFCIKTLHHLAFSFSAVVFQTVKLKYGTLLNNIINFSDISKITHVYGALSPAQTNVKNKKQDTLNQTV